MKEVLEEKGITKSEMLELMQTSMRDMMRSEMQATLQDTVHSEMQTTLRPMIKADIKAEIKVEMKDLIVEIAETLFYAIDATIIPLKIDIAKEIQDLDERLTNLNNGSEIVNTRLRYLEKNKLGKYEFKPLVRRVEKLEISHP